MLPLIAGATTFLVAACGTPAWMLAAVVAGGTWLIERTAHRRVDRAVARLEAEQMQSLRLREEQLANTAHELRTPLTAVTTAIELLRDGYATTPEDWSIFLDQASVASRHMAFLINDVVDLAAIECGRISLHVKEQRAQELVFDVAQVMQLTAQQRDVELRIEEPPENLFVAADRGRFLQVVFNLVGNAIKFSDGGALVRLVTCVEDDRVTFEVHDHGPGVDPELRERLFTRFGRVHDKSRPSISGTGLGLHVCKRLVEHMGGTIGYRPGQDRGSVFWFTLPRAQSTIDRPAAPLTAPTEVAQLEIASA